MVSKHDTGTSGYQHSVHAGCMAGLEAGLYIHPDWNTFGFFNVSHLHISST